MGRAWVFRSAGQIVFGAGSAERCGELLRRLGARRYLLVTDPPLATHAAALREAAAGAGVVIASRKRDRCELAAAEIEASTGRRAALAVGSKR